MMQLLAIVSLSAIVFAIGLSFLVAAFYTARRTAFYNQTYPADGHIFTSDAGSLHYWFGAQVSADPGDDERTPLVFVHGASSNGRDAQTAFDGEFGARRMIYLDRPGHGHSARISRHLADPARQADCIAALLDHLKIDRVVLVGHSWGASVVAAFGVKHSKRLAGAAFLAPATHPWPGGVLWYYTLASWPLIGAFFAHTLALPVGERRVDCAIENVFAPDPVPLGYRARVGAELVLRPRTFLANAQDVAQLKNHVTHLSKAYHFITCPAVIITGTDDQVVWPHLHAYGLKRDLPNAKLVEIAGGGHMPHHSQTETVIATLKDLLTDIDKIADQTP